MKQNERTLTLCEECENYIYDEESDEYYCEMSSNMDEDEYLSFLGGGRCPFYRYADEYRIVRKQN